MADPGYAAPPPGQADYQQPPPPAYGAPQQPGYGQPQQLGYGQPAVVVATQPQAHHTTIIQGAPPRPSNYLILAIFVTICCSLPFGESAHLYCMDLNEVKCVLINNYFRFYTFYSSISLLKLRIRRTWSAYCLELNSIPAGTLSVILYLFHTTNVVKSIFRSNKFR